MNLDDELRELFTADDRHDVPVRQDAEALIVAGARRVRRRRIVAATASGALGVVAAVVAAVALGGGSPDALPPATDVPTTLPAASSVRVTTQTTPTSAHYARTSTPSRTTTTTTRPRTNAVPPQTVTQPPPDLGYPRLGPAGLKGLVLGQTLDEAQATGMLGQKTGNSGPCGVYELVDDQTTGSVYISTTVQAIFADPTQTPEGVGAGWTIAQAKAVYPALDDAVAAAGQAVVPVPGNSAAAYGLQFADGKVTQVSLRLSKQLCF